MRYALASLALAYLVVMSPTNSELQTGMIPVVDTKGITGPILNPCLIAAYPMNEGTGLILHDTKGTNNATISSAPAVTWQSNFGYPGTTPLWNGTGNAVSASTTVTNFTGTTPFSVSLWVNGGGVYLSTLDTAGGTLRGWELVQTSGVMQFGIYNTYPGNRLEGNIPLIPGAGLPNFVVITYDGSQSVSGVTAYNNGVPDTFSSTANTLSASAANGLPITFGARKNGSLELSGRMAFVEIYNCVVSSGFVASSFAAGPGIY